MSIEDLEANSHICTAILFLANMSETYIGKKIAASTNDVRKIRYSYTYKTIKLEPVSFTLHKANSKWLKGLKMCLL